MQSCVAFPLLCVAIVGVLLTPTVLAFRDAPIFTLDYAKPPEERWSGAVETILKLHPWEDSFGPLFDHYNSTLVSKISPTQHATLQNILYNRYHGHFLELMGIANDFAINDHPEVNIHFLVIWSFYHELAHSSDLDFGARYGRECTGILALPSDESKSVIHARNLDQSIPAARNLTLQIQAVNSSTDSSKTLYQAVDFYWMTSGFVTAQKLDYITLEENWRSADIHPPQSLAQIIARLDNGVTLPQVLMFRHILENVIADMPPSDPKTFTRVVDFLNSTSFAAPFYGIISGPGRQGAILSISFYQDFNHIYYLGAPTAPDSWFLVQTNYDRWKPDPPSDNRRTYAEHAMRRLGQDYGATRVGAWMGISEFPVHNADTFYSLLMSIDEPTRGFIREAMKPVRYSPP